MKTISKFLREARKKMLLAKMEERAKKCTSELLALDNANKSPSQSEVWHIWKSRYEDLVLKRLETSIVQQSFIEALAAYEHYIYCNKIKQHILPILKNKGLSYRPKNALEANKLYSDTILIDQDLSKHFCGLVGKIATEEADRYTSYNEAREKYYQYYADNDLVSAIKDVWRKRLEFLNEQDTLANVNNPYSAEEIKLRIKECYSTKAREAWENKLSDLRDKEAVGHASENCLFNEVLAYYSNSINGSLAKNIWARRLDELAQDQCQLISDIEEIKSMHEKLPKDSLAQTEFLIRYMEVAISGK